MSVRGNYGIEFIQSPWSEHKVMTSGEQKTRRKDAPVNKALAKATKANAVRMLGYCGFVPIITKKSAWMRLAITRRFARACIGECPNVGLVTSKCIR